MQKSMTAILQLMHQIHDKRRKVPDVVFTPLNWTDNEKKDD